MIIIQAATENTIGSALIRWFTWSSYSHVDFVLPDGRLLGARLKGGVQIREPGYANFTKTKRFVIDGPDSILDWAKSQVGKPYDWRAIVAFAYHHDWKSRDAWFCSELVAAACLDNGIRLLNEQVNRVTPGQLIESPLIKPC